MVSVIHPFHSAKSDGADNTLVQPSSWNAAHTFTTSSGNVVLGVNGVAGAVAENTCTAQGFSILAAADVPSLPFGAFTTGDVKLTIKTAADAGWVMMNDGTIGDATSGASTRANADTSALFQLIWNNISDADAPVVGGRGGSAATDFAAHKKITLPLVLGRALAGAGSGSGLTARALGHAVGEENHQLTQSELPNINLTINSGTVNVGVPNVAPWNNLVNHNNNGGSAFSFGSTGDFLYTNNMSVAQAPTVTPNEQLNIGSKSSGPPAASAVCALGDGTAHNNMQPTTFLNVMIKL